MDNLLTLNELARLAREVAHETDPRLTVVGAVNGKGGTEYAEVILVVDQEPSTATTHIAVGVSRRDTPHRIQRTLESSLRQHLFDD